MLVLLNTNIVLVVDGKPLGMAMHEAKLQGRGIDPLFTFDVRDKREKMMLKDLASAMLNCNAKQRPNIDVVLRQLETIAGEACL